MPLSRLSIKHQLLIIVFIIALPAICIIINSGIQQRRSSIKDAKLETQQLAETIVNEQRNLIASTRQLFIALSQIPEVINHEPIEVKAILAEILKLSPQYSNIYIADSSGVVWASGVPLNGTMSVAGSRFFKSALASGKLSSGEYDVAKDSKNPTIDFGYPLINGTGRVTSVICAGLSLDYYRKILDVYKLPKGASFALLDHKGIILDRAIEPEKYTGKPANPEIFQYMLDGPEEETSIGTSSVIGDNRIQTYIKISLEGEQKPYMYIRAGIPTESVMSKSNLALLKNLIVYSGSLLVAFLLSWVIGKRFIIDRVLALQRSSQRLAEGDLSIRVAHEVCGGEIGQLGLAFDDMAKKLASREQALRESENNYRDIFNTTHDALFVSDESGKIIEANRSAEIMFEYTREELLRMSVEDFTAGEPPYSFSEALVLIEKSLKEGTQETEWLSRRKNSQSFWTEITISPTSLVGEKHVLAVIRDITERKEMEKFRESMLSNISHDMRTPLTAMLGFLEFVIENQVEGAQLKDYHMTMRKEGDRLNEMITNFLDMQRLKAKMHQYNFNPLDVRALLEEVVAIFSNPSINHSIIINAPSNLASILGDEELLHQALSNLLSNAIKYSPPSSEVILDAYLEDNKITLWVKDQGIGIPSESLDRIFDMFYRVESTVTRHVTGTGLGLALVKEVVAAHNGQVWVESTEGQGSTFYISLPVFGDDLRKAS